MTSPRRVLPYCMWPRFIRIKKIWKRQRSILRGMKILRLKMRGFLGSWDSFFLPRGIIKKRLITMKNIWFNVRRIKRRGLCWERPVGPLVRKGGRRKIINAFFICRGRCEILHIFLYFYFGDTWFFFFGDWRRGSEKDLCEGGRGAGIEIMAHPFKIRGEIKGGGGGPGKIRRGLPKVSQG